MLSEISTPSSLHFWRCCSSVRSNQSLPATSLMRSWYGFLFHGRSRLMVRRWFPSGSLCSIFSPPQNFSARWHVISSTRSAICSKSENAQYASSMVNSGL